MGTVHGQIYQALILPLLPDPNVESRGSSRCNVGNAVRLGVGSIPPQCRKTGPAPGALGAWIL